MRLSKFLTASTLLPALLLAPQAFAHPGHSHPPDAVQRLLHAAMTEWHWLLICCALLVAGILFLRRKT